MNQEIEAWRKYLRRDPTRFLLDAEANPSVYLWFLIDIAHRPEDSIVVKDARDRLLFSVPVQEILAAQDSEGYWHTPESLSQPYFRATLWNLALLAELGIPRDSRRARAACEFALGYFLDEGGNFAGLDTIESGYLIHALSYFRLESDARVIRAAMNSIEPALVSAALAPKVIALWAWANLSWPSKVSSEVDLLREQILSLLESEDGDRWAPITFPPFHPLDPLFIARIIAKYDCANDPRAKPLIQAVVAKQNDQSYWPLDKSLNGSLAANLEDATTSSRWSTLNALRVIVKLVENDNG